MWPGATADDLQKQVAFRHVWRQPWLNSIFKTGRLLVVWIWSQTMAWLAKRYYRSTNAPEQGSIPWSRALDGCCYDCESILNRYRSMQGQPPRKTMTCMQLPPAEDTSNPKLESQIAFRGKKLHNVQKCLGRPLPRQRWLCCRTNLCFRSFDIFSGVTWRHSRWLTEASGFSSMPRVSLG